MLRFAERLAQLRESAGISQVELGRRLNVHHVTVHGWETGKRHPNADQVPEIADALGVSPAEFYMDDRESEIVRDVLRFLKAEGSSSHDDGNDNVKVLIPPPFARIFPHEWPELGRSPVTSGTKLTDNQHMNSRQEVLV